MSYYPNPKRHKLDNGDGDTGPDWSEDSQLRQHRSTGIMRTLVTLSRASIRFKENDGSIASAPQMPKMSSNAGVIGLNPNPVEEGKDWEKLTLKIQKQNLWEQLQIRKEEVAKLQAEVQALSTEKNRYVTRTLTHYLREVIKAIQNTDKNSNNQALYSQLLACARDRAPADLDKCLEASLGTIMRLVAAYDPYFNNLINKNLPPPEDLQTQNHLLSLQCEESESKIEMLEKQINDLTWDNSKLFESNWKINEARRALHEKYEALLKDCHAEPALATRSAVNFEDGRSCHGHGADFVDGTDNCNPTEFSDGSVSEEDENSGEINEPVSVPVSMSEARQVSEPPVEQLAAGGSGSQDLELKSKFLLMQYHYEKLKELYSNLQESVSKFNSLILQCVEKGEVAELQDQLKLKEEILLAAGLVIKYKSEMEELTASLENSQSENERLGQLSTNAMQLLRQLHQQWDQRKKEHLKCKRKLRNLNDALTAMKKSCLELEFKANAVTAMGEAASPVQLLQQDQSPQTTIDQQAKELALMRKDLLNRQKVEGSYLREIESTGRALDEMAATNSRILSDLGSKDKKIMKLVEEIYNFKKRLELSRKENELLQQQISANNESLSQERTVKVLLEEKEGLLTRTLVFFEKETNMTREQARELAEKTDELVVKNENLQSSYEANRIELEKKRKEVSEMETKIKNLTSALLPLKEKEKRLAAFERGGSMEVALLEEIKICKNKLQCSICAIRPKNSALRCGHTFCDECIRTRYESRSRRCPHCAKAFTNADATNPFKIYI